MQRAKVSFPRFNSNKEIRRIFFPICDHIFFLKNSPAEEEQSGGGVRSYVHVVRVWCAGRLRVLLILSPHKPVVVLQLLLPLLFLVNFLCASSLWGGAQKIQCQIQGHMTTDRVQWGSHRRNVHQESEDIKMEQWLLDWWKTLFFNAYKCSWCGHKNHGWYCKN